MLMNSTLDYQCTCGRSNARMDKWFDAVVLIICCEQSLLFAQWCICKLNTYIAPKSLSHYIYMHQSENYIFNSSYNLLTLIIRVENYSILIYFISYLNFQILFHYNFCNSFYSLIFSFFYNFKRATNFLLESISFYGHI